MISTEVVNHNILFIYFKTVENADKTQASLCVQKRQFSLHKALTLFNNVYEILSCLPYAKAIAGLHSQRLQMFTLTVGSEALTFCSEGMHFIKEPHHAAGLHSSVYSRFTTGIPNMRFHKINFENFQGFDHWRLPDCIQTSSKTTLRRHKLDNTVLLHSSPPQVKIIWDMNDPFGFKCKLKRAFAASKIHSKA